MLEHRVAAAPEPGVEEHLAHVLESDRVTVEQVLAFAALEDAPRDRDLRPVTLESAGAVVEDERDLGHRERRARRRALEDDVGHLRSAHRSRSLLSEHPAHGVDHVALAAAVRPDDAGQGLVAEFEDGSVGEGLEAEEFESFQAHGRGVMVLRGVQGQG